MPDKGNSLSRRVAISIFLLVPVLLFMLYAIVRLLLLAGDARLGPPQLGIDGGLRRDAHISVMFPGNQRDFYSQIRSGLQDYLESQGQQSLGLQYLEPFPFMSAEESLFRHSEIAALAQVDGVVIAPVQSRRISSLLARSRLEGIPVVALNSNLEAGSVDTVIGVDSFSLGVRIGEILSGSELSSGVYIQGANTLIPQSAEFISGFRAALFPLNRRLPLEISGEGDDGLGLRSTVESVLSRVPEIDLVIADSPDLTLILAQAVVESNLVGRLTIVGVRGAAEIDEYFESEVISYLISVNPEEIAIKTIEALAGLLAGETVAGEVPVSVRIEEAGGGE